MIPSQLPLVYLKPYNGNVEPCHPNPKNPVAQQLPRLLVTKSRTEGLQSTFRDPECFPTRMCHQPPLYFTQNSHEACSDDYRGPESQHAAGQVRLPLLYLRSLRGDCRDFHPSHESQRPTAQPHLPCIFVRTGTETGNPSQPNLPDHQTSGQYQPPLVPIRNCHDHLQFPCHCSEDPQTTVHHREPPHSPYVYIRSPTGDHGKPTRAAERIQAIFPSHPPLVATRHYPPDQAEALSSTPRQQSPFYFVKPASERSCNFYSGSESTHLPMQHQPSLASIKASLPQATRELHKPEGPQKAQSYLWIRSAPSDQRDRLPSPEARCGCKQPNPSYIWIRNAPRARSESRMDMENPQTVTQQQPPIVSIRRSPVGQKNDQSPESRTSLVEPPPSFILIRRTSRDIAKARCSVESMEDRERSLSPVACDDTTRNHKSSPSSESLQLEMQNQPPPVPPKSPPQSLLSNESVVEHQPAEVSRTSIPEDPSEIPSRPPGFQTSMPPLFLLLRTGANGTGTRAFSTERLPQPPLFIRTVCDCQTETIPTPEDFPTVIKGHLPFAGQFPEGQGETCIRLERLHTMVQDPSASGALPNDESESHTGLWSHCGPDQPQPPGDSTESIPSRDLDYYERLSDMEKNHPAYVPMRPSSENWLKRPPGSPSVHVMYDPPSLPLSSPVFEHGSKSFPAAGKQQPPSCLSSQATVDYLHSSIPSSAMLPSLLQNQLTLLSDGDQRHFHSKKTVFDQQPPASVFTASSEEQETGFPGEVGLNTLKQEPPIVHSPESSPADESRSSPILESPGTSVSQQSCYLPDAAVNENNSSPHAQSPELLEEKQASFRLIQSILENYESCSASPSLRSTRHVQPPSISMTAIPEDFGTADFSPHLRSVKSLEQHPTPCLRIRTMAGNHSDPCPALASLQASADAHPPRVSLKAISEGKRGTKSDPRHPSPKLLEQHPTPYVLIRHHAESHCSSYSSYSSFQVCGPEQPPAINVRTFPENVRVTKRNPHGPQRLEQRHMPQVLIRSMPEECLNSCRGSRSFQGYEYGQPPAISVQSFTEKLGATDSDPKWPPATVCQQPLSFLIQIIPEDQNKPVSSSDSQPITGVPEPALLLTQPGARESGAKAPPSSPFVFFRVVPQSECEIAHRCPSPQPYQTAPNPRSYCSTSRRLWPLRVSHGSHHASKMRQIMLQYQLARTSLGAISEDESKVRRSPGCSLAPGKLLTPIVPMGVGLTLPTPASRNTGTLLYKNYLWKGRSELHNMNL